MARLSVNVNKVATLRNSRTRQPPDRSAGLPSVIEAARVCVDAGAPGITVHPRGDARHITTADVLELAEVLAPLRDTVELNIEGDPREDLVALVERIAPHQFTLVPVAVGEITSSAGWDTSSDASRLREVIARTHAVGTRVSVFVDAELAPVRWAASLGADRIEIFTEPFAHAWATDRGLGEHRYQACVAAAELAHALGLGVNAGHDLDLDNLLRFRDLPHLDEVSIGHALIGRALYVGLATTVREYLQVLAEKN
ncbi:MAG TPA: pyridoxine 5'-phosphate synthase [Nannocystaceae bacterium]|nr:pyridoxine 5'-phosphate synthase [Nannocystaceae bacterium]